MACNEKELYEKMIHEVLEQKVPEYRSLITLVEEILMWHIKKNCSDNKKLVGRDYHEDIIQDVLIRIIKSVDRFYEKTEDGYKYKPLSEFKSWCFTIANNLYLDNYTDYKKIKPGGDAPIDEIIDFLGIDKESDEPFISIEEEEIRRDKLNKCFSVVMDLSSKPHIILTWLCVSLVMLKSDVNRIEATHLVDDIFENKTLCEMFEFVVIASKVLPWMTLSQQQISKQMSKLEKIHDSGKVTGDMKYSDFYMADGAEKSISDWYNRMNTRIKERWVFDEE